MTHSSCPCVKPKSRKRKKCGCDSYRCPKRRCMNFTREKKPINPKKKRRKKQPKETARFAFLK